MLISMDWQGNCNMKFRAAMGWLGLKKADMQTARERLYSRRVARDRLRKPYVYEKAARLASGYIDLSSGFC